MRVLDRRYDEKPRSFGGHLRTLFAIHDVDDMIRLDTPWWTYGAIGLVEEHLRRCGGNARVFEYGSGASSLWLAARSGEVHTVEHDAWFADVMRGALARSASGARVTLHEVLAEEMDRPITRSGRRGEDTVDYTKYARSVEIPGGLFDLVVVDGRARVACMEEALSHLAPGGLLVFDDAQRPRYRAGIRASGLPVRNSWGMVPSLPYPRQTAVLGPRQGPA
jgi:hypothetical protein